jgi:hypothetical protein
MVKETLMSWKRLAVIVGLAVALGATGARAQPKKDWKSFFGHVGGGWTLVDGEAADVINDGWNLNGGFTYKPPSWPVGIVGDLGYNDFRVKSSALSIDGERIADKGSVSIWSLTAGLTWTAPTQGKVGFFLSGGGGAYRVRGVLTDPAAYEGWICDPWSWWCYPGIIVGDQIVAERTTTKAGYNAGIGISFELASSSEIYLEAKYHSVNTKERTNYIPIVIGYRW